MSSDYLSAIGGVGAPIQARLEGPRFERFFGLWYNSGLNSTPNAANPAFFALVPSLAYDSWVTIGAASSLETPSTINSIWGGDIDPNGQFASSAPQEGPFPDFDGKNIIVVDDETGGSWYVLWPGSYDADNAAFAHEDLRSS